MKLLKNIFGLLLMIGCFMHPCYAAIFTVTNNANAGAGSLRQAIMDANASAGKDTVEFEILPDGSYTITLAAELIITGDILIDGTTQDPSATAPTIAIAGSPAMGLFINSGAAAAGSEIRSIAIHGCAAAGIVIVSPNNIIAGCYIGLTLTGTAAPNGAAGVQITAANNNIIGGATVSKRNIISANNGHGISGDNSSGNVIVGNYIGTNVAGLGDMGNGGSGIIFFNSSSNNKIGGSTADSSNVVSGNGLAGVDMMNASQLFIIGNKLGLGADGVTAIGNGTHGIQIARSTTVIVGGNSTNKANIISSNNSHGILISNSSVVTIQGNLIGTDNSGTLKKGNKSHGIQLQDTVSAIVIGGRRFVEGNIISCNEGMGINFQDHFPTNGKAIANGTIIKGNLIGTDITATQNFGNLLFGIILKSDNCVIGDTSNNEGNVIGGSSIFGLLMANANNTIVRGNFIGTSLDSTSMLGNGLGIFIAVENAGQTARNNIIHCNAIAYNTNEGIVVGGNIPGQNQNSIRFNSIYCNGDLGISLNLTGSGEEGNNGKTAPVINAALSNSTTLYGLPNGLAATDFIDIYEMTECVSCDVNPQGKRYVATVQPDAAGNWSYSTGSPLPGTLVATATDINGNTSEFSLCYTPCGLNATAQISSPVVNLLAPEIISLTSVVEPNLLNPAPVNYYWSLNTPDTAVAEIFSALPTTALNFANNTYAVSGDGDYKIYFIARQAACLDTVVLSLKAYHIPNLVTPNNDGHNEKWVLTQSSDLLDVTIYNRWGEAVFSKEGYTNEWDIANVSEGVYYFQLKSEVESLNEYRGWVQVVK